MAASLSELPEALPVDPGGEVVATVRVHNGSDRVDRLVVEVLGEPAAWTQVEPPEVALFPEADGTATLRFRPPRVASTAPGRVPFGVRLRSLEQDGETVAVEEGSLEVAPFYETAVDVMPRTSRGRRRGKHELAFDNRGNTTVTGTIGAVSPDSPLAFGVHPQQLVAPPGTAVFAKVRVKPKQRSWRGVPQLHAFKLHVDSEGAPRAVTDAFLLQEPLIPRGVLPVVVALAVLALAWALVLKPTPKPTAQQIGNSQAQAAAQSADATAKAAGAQAAAATKSAAQAQKTAAKAAAAAASAKAAAKAAVAATAVPKAEPYSTRLVLDCPPKCRIELQVPEHEQLSLTDVVFGNPLGDAGLLTLARGEQVLFVEGLGNFHDLPFHFATPLVLDAKHALVLLAECKNAAGDAGGTPAACTPAAYVTGTLALEPKAPAKKTTAKAAPQPAPPTTR